MNKLHATNHNVQERETKVSYVVHVPKTATSCLIKRNSIPYHGSLAEWLNQRETPIEKILKAFYIIEVSYHKNESMNITGLNSGAAQGSIGWLICCTKLKIMHYFSKNGKFCWFLQYCNNVLGAINKYLPNAKVSWCCALLNMM